MFDEETDSTTNILAAGLSFSIALFLAVSLLADILSRDCINIVTILGDNDTVKRFQAYGNSILLDPFSSRLKFKNAQTNEYVYLKDASFTLFNKYLSR